MGIGASIFQKHQHRSFVISVYKTIDALAANDLALFARLWKLELLIQTEALFSFAVPPVFCCTSVNKLGTHLSSFVEIFLCF